MPEKSTNNTCRMCGSRLLTNQFVSTCLNDNVSQQHRILVAKCEQMAKPLNEKNDVKIQNVSNRHALSLSSLYPHFTFPDVSKGPFMKCPLVSNRYGPLVNNRIQLDVKRPNVSKGQLMRCPLSNNGCPLLRNEYGPLVSNIIYVDMKKDKM